MCFVLFFHVMLFLSLHYRNTLINTRPGKQSPNAPVTTMTSLQTEEVEEWEKSKD